MTSAVMAPAAIPSATGWKAMIRLCASISLPLRPGGFPPFLGSPPRRSVPKPNTLTELLDIPALRQFAHLRLARSYCYRSAADEAKDG